MRAKLYGMHNPVRGALNAAAALSTLLGAVVLTLYVDALPASPLRNLALGVFGASLLCLFVVSGLYHSVPWSRRWKKRWKRVDHSMIYVVVAGTYTPLVVIGLDGGMRVAALLAIWSVAGLGIALKVLTRGMYTGLSIALQVGLGWFGVLLVPALAERVPPTALLLLLTGGLCYTLGATFFVLRRPRLWPRVYSYHEAFHTLVVAGSATHALAIFGWVARLP